ncbi:MAG TPA: sigma-54-dependent Fis family transcriptional regulator, partial [Firmicutes bacterium]|nr:sigma-54-dependent Fis family transcriptional regulator [Bacillota bacterium]
VLRNEPVAAAVLDLRLGDEDGLAVLTELRAVEPELPVIIITAYGTIASAVEAMRRGAFSYLTKPLNLEELKLALVRAVEHAALSRRVRELTATLVKESLPWGMVAKSRAMQPVLALIERAKDIDATVLISGASGTGKELVARALHFGGRRAKGPWEVINCAAIPATLLESELFGYAAGAFTGATRSHTGRFAAAHGGTLFLDEVGELEPALQAKLLRVLEDKLVRPLGAGKSQRVDVRVVAATSRDLKKEVEAGRFRPDLYFRLNVVAIHLPPLKERREDIPLLTQHFLARIAERVGSPPLRLSPEALAALEVYAFPGNVRELENALERAAALAQGPAIPVADLPPEIRSDSAALRAVPPEGEQRVVLPVGISLAEAEKELILSTLQAYGGNRRRTAEVLGISERGLRDKLKGYRRVD